MLLECDVIYTTQVRNAETLEKLFRNVRFIPDSCDDLMAFLKSRHPGAEFIEFPHVFAIAGKKPECPHYQDNQGFCHKCGIVMDEGAVRDSGYWQEGMVEGK